MVRSTSRSPLSRRHSDWDHNGAVLDHELSQSYDEIVDVHARVHHHQTNGFAIDVDHSTSDDERQAYVHFQSPRALQETVARVADLVHDHDRQQQQRQIQFQSISRSQSTRSSSPLPSPSSVSVPVSGSSGRPGMVQRPGIQQMRQFRSQRLLSMASDKTNGSNPSTTSHENGSDASHHDHSHSQSHSRHRRGHAHGHAHGASAAAMLNCPSSHYYIDARGRLQARRMWWIYTRVRRFVSHFLPGFKRDDNTFLCAPMISNTTLILVVSVLRLLMNDALLTSLLTDEQQKECHDFSSELLDFFSFSLLGNALLCVPAFNFSFLKLFKRVKPAQSKRELNKTPVNGALGLEPLGGMDATGAPMATAAATDGAVVHDDDHPKLKKTYLFTACELLVIIEIPYLVYIFVTMFFPAAVIVNATSQHSDLWSVTTRCATTLPLGVFLTFLLAQTIGLVAYVLRWNQIILFHRMHEHFLYQRGCVPGRARFDYVEESFLAPWVASRRSKQIHAIKTKLYHAAKYGEIDEVRTQIENATLLDGPDFAHKWYDQTGFAHRVFGQRFVKCQRNPLHVAVAFDNGEIVQELLSNGMFDIHQGEKMELLKLNISWIYRFFFDIVPMLRMSNYSRHKTRLVFGPVGLFCSTLLTPLHVAVSMGNTDMVLLLLRFGADPNLSAESSHRKFRTPPLFWAINKECTRLLLDADANPVFVPGGGYFLTAFEVARVVGNHAVAMEIEKYGGDVALTPLHDACARGFKKEVRFYLEHGTLPDTFGEKVTGFFRRTPLHWAAIRGETKIVKLLLKFGAQVDAKDAFGRTPLTWACLLNRVKTVQVLLKYGADVNVRDIQGDPLLCICAAGTCASPSSEAFTSDANHRGGGRSGERRMTRTEQTTATGTATTTTSRGNDFTSSQTAKTLDPEIFEMLQSVHIDLYATREANGDTALHVALRKNNEATAILFVRAGMSLTAVNYVGQRAMDCTISSSLRYAIKKEAGHRDVMISYCHSHSALARKVRDALEAAYITTWIDSMDPSGITGGSVWRQEIAQGIRSSALVLALLTRDYPVSQWCMKELAFAKMHNVPIVAIQCEDMQMTEELQVYLWTRQIVDFRPAFVERVVEVREPPRPAETKSQPANKKMSGHAAGNNCNNSNNHKDGDDVDDDEALLAQQDPRDAAEEHDDGVVAKPTLVVKHEYDDELFRNCMRLLLDGIHDQIEEHRVKRVQRQERQKMLLRARSVNHNGDGHGGVLSSGDESDASDAHLSDGDQPHGGMSGVPHHRTLRRHRAAAAAANGSDGSESDGDGARLRVADERRLSHTSSFVSATSSSSSPPSYVFIAHGDYHLSFCQRLRNALQKQGVRCILDQAVPSIQYAGGGHGVVAGTSPRQLQRLQSAATNQSAGYGSGSETATTTAQARQLAAKDAILDSTAVIVVLSPISAKCDMLTDQLAFAEDRGKLIVPLMLSLQTVDLAKRYTFSRSVVQHFNVSLGFEQSLDRLVVYLQQTGEAMRRQQQHKEHELLQLQLQLKVARRQRRKDRDRQRRRRRRARGESDEGGGLHDDTNDHDDDGEDDDDADVNDGSSLSPVSSPASSVRSSMSRLSAVRAVSPSSFAMAAEASSSAHGRGSGSDALPPTIPILQPSRQPGSGGTSGHGWSISTPSPPARESASSLSPPRGGMVLSPRHSPSTTTTTTITTTTGSGATTALASNYRDSPESRPREPPHHFGSEPLLRHSGSVQSPLSTPSRRK